MEIKTVPIAQIKINRDSRQRKKLTGIEELQNSIQRFGLINPIIIDENYNLIAGERRLTAVTALGRDSITCRFLSDLDEADRTAVELEENIKRSDLAWQDQCEAIAKLHKLYADEAPDWTRSDTAKALGMSDAEISRRLDVAEALRAGDEMIVNAPKFSTASGIVARQKERRQSDAATSLMDSVIGEISGEASAPKPAPTVTSTGLIQCGDFIQWSARYKGPRFNLIHCDFPYGINANTFAQGAAKVYGGYEDSPDIYWNLMQALLDNINNYCADSAHLIFWFSMDYYQETFDALSKQFRVNPFPLVWQKTDGAGILPDPARGPRRTYETAFFASRGDRKIVRAVSNSVGASVTRGRHMSEKSQDVLRHFLRMVVDESTRLLDPTCGSGSALRAGHTLGVTDMLGLELNSTFAETADMALAEAMAEEHPDE